MTTIKRFTPDYKMHAVRFDAHQQEVSALKTERDALEVRLRNALTSEQEAIQRAHAANQTANALAVENAALKRERSELSAIGELIRTQDNRITDQPFFAVMTKRKSSALKTTTATVFAGLKTRAVIMSKPQRHSIGAWRLSIRPNMKLGMAGIDTP
ncbi:hypothetical protein M5585_24075 [Serratia ureilytica]